MQNLVIIESPGKIHSINNYLGSSYKVVASIGHVRDLPKSTLGVDIENDFAPHYINIRGKGPLIKELKDQVKKADRVFLATDPDREGEAISWHLVTALSIPESKIKRVTFNEITKTAVKDGIKHPREIDMNLVNAQQARRILDRIVGYKLSPYLWKSVKSGLSAGRVQSVATKIIVERENEIRAFVPVEYWNIDAVLENSQNRSFTAHFYGTKDGQKLELHNEGDTSAVMNAVSDGEFTVSSIKKGQKYKNPAAPFITSTLQQEASRKLNFQSQRTMKVAQELYEGINLGAELGGTQGLITYMRTDSLRIADEARESAKNYIISKYGESYYPQTPRIYKTKANAQDAHEAIRPSGNMHEPSVIKKFLTNDQYKIYKLIWDRFMASQMASAVLSTVACDITCGDYLFRSSGYTVDFTGYMAVYEESTDDPEKDDDKNTRLPALNENEILKTDSVTPSQHYTEPPARYTEASLIKFLEEKGIGRPSTITPIITLIISRGYVKRDGRSLVPTQTGEVTTKLMNENFPDVVDYQFTAQMESKLDDIENGTATTVDVLRNFYTGFEQELDKAMSTIPEEIDIPDEETDIVCENCGVKMVVKNGRFGKFAACPNYPACKNTKPLTIENGKYTEKKPEIAPEKCELCGADMILRVGRYGSFYACSRYPECKFTKQKTKNLGVKCPQCGAEIVTKYGRNKTVFYSCEKYPECQFSSWDMPTNEKCPTCGSMLFVKKAKNQLVCKKEGCGYRRDMTDTGNSDNTEAEK